MIWNYILTALRNFGKNRIYAGINVLGLCLGMACTMMIMLYVKDELSYDRFQEKGDRIYRVVTSSTNEDGTSRWSDSNTGYLQGPRFAAGVPEIREFVRVQSGHADIKTGTEVVSEELLYVDPNFFEVFTFPLLSGDPETCLKEPNTVVLSEDEAKEKFGRVDVVGEVLNFRDGEKFVPYEVTGVARRCPENSSIKFNMLLPLIEPADVMSNDESWFNFFLNTFVLTETGADIAFVNEKIQNIYVSESAEATRIMLEKYGDPGPPPKYFLQPFTAMHLSKELPAQNGLSDASDPVYSYILSGIAIFILLLACINFINLTIARSIRRAKEIGVRRVVGGSRKQLAIQFLGETFLLCLFAFVLAIVLVQLTLPSFNRFANKALDLAYLLDFKLVAGFLLLLIVTALVAGFYPALVLSGYHPVKTLYQRVSLSGKNYLQKSLVVLQFALASFFIISTFVVYQQFNFLTHKELGYNDDNLVIVGKHMLSRDDLSLFRTRLISDPAIINVAARNMGMWSTAAKVNTETQIHFAYETVDESYIPMLEIPVVQGRNFSKDITTDGKNAVLVNESFVKEAGWTDPIGQEVNFWYADNEKYNVIGVVKDYHFRSLSQEIGPQLFTMKEQNPLGQVLIKINPAMATDAIQKIEATFKDQFPMHPYSYVFKDDENRSNYETEAKWRQIMLLSAVLTIFISCIGLFGLAVLAAERRTKEVGIRKVLGASVDSVVYILSRDFIRLVLLAMIIAMPVAWIVANHWLQNYPYRIEVGMNPFILSAILVLIIAIITVSFQAIKAAVMNPVKSIRTE